MNYYIAGINLSKDARTLHKGITLCNKVIELLPTILKEAKNKYGEDVVVIVPLQEYAFTKYAVNRETKNNLLKELKEAVSNEANKSSNLLLIPGSFSYHSLSKKDEEEVKDSSQMLVPDSNSDHLVKQINKYEAKKNKIKKAYENNSAVLKADPPLENLKNHFLNVIQEDKAMWILHNTAWLIADGVNLKHHKAAPWFEDDKMVITTTEEEENLKNLVFRIGNDESVKTITFKSKVTLDIATLICREQLFECLNTPLAKAKPTVQVVVSDPIDPETCHGAINIFMDSQNGLQVIIDRTHQKSPSVHDITAVQYTLDDVEEELKLVSCIEIKPKELKMPDTLLSQAPSTMFYKQNKPMGEEKKTSLLPENH